MAAMTGEVKNRTPATTRSILKRYFYRWHTKGMCSSPLNNGYRDANAMARITLAEVAANPPKLSAAERKRLGAMSDDEIDANAEADLDHPEMTDDQLDRAVFARDVRRAREATGLTQGSFARKFKITLSRLKDWEQARFKPDSVAAAYIKVIRHDSAAVERALDADD
jgi:putative transcriptional regulator